MNPSLTAVAAFENHLILTGRGPRTADKYARIIAAFTKWRHAGAHGDEATALAAWITEARRTLGAAAIRLRLAAARAYCDFLGVDRGALTDYRKPPLPEAEPHPLPGGMDAGRAMIAAASTTAAANAIALGLLAGLRVSETISVTRASFITVDGGDLVLRVKGKGEKQRDVPVSSELERVLHVPHAGGKLVPLGDSGARAAITRAAERAGVRGHDGAVSSHDLRATFATAVHDKTGDIVLVKKLLGHTSIATTQRYIGSTRSAARAAVEL